MYTLLLNRANSVKSEIEKLLEGFSLDALLEKMRPDDITKLAEMMEAGATEQELMEFIWSRVAHDNPLH